MQIAQTREMGLTGTINSDVVTKPGGSESNMHRGVYSYHRCEYRATESSTLRSDVCGDERFAGE